jgi:toxin ParE1/3/4
LGEAQPVRLRYTLPALADLDSILDHIAERSPQGANRVHARIRTVIDLLLIHPYIGSRTDDPTIRRLTTPPYPYLVFYEVTEVRSLSMRSDMVGVILPECLAPPKAAADADHAIFRRRSRASWRSRQITNRPEAATMAAPT